MFFGSQVASFELGPWLDAARRGYMRVSFGLSSHSFSNAA